MEKKKGFVTIGHGKTDLQIFMRMLVKYRVNMIVDVRSTPYSKYSPQYNKEGFEAALAKQKIAYKWLGKMLGGRPDDNSTYDEDGVVNYERLVKTPVFCRGIFALEELSESNNIAIMCSEHEPIKCHRFMAISRELTNRGYRVVHIIDFNKYVKQSDLEELMIKQHFGENVQLDLFSSMDDTLAQSYTKQNKLCGYRRK